MHAIHLHGRKGFQTCAVVALTGTYPNNSRLERIEAAWFYSSLSYSTAVDAWRMLEPKMAGEKSSTHFDIIADTPLESGPKTFSRWHRK